MLHARVCLIKKKPTNLFYMFIYQRTMSEIITAIRGKKKETV